VARQARYGGVMSLCVFAGGKAAALAASVFTLSWTHSVEKTRWEETWHLTPAGMQIIEARVKGSGAGMEPFQDALLERGWWVYKPRLPPQPKLLLSSSGTTGGGWTLCAADTCRELGATSGEAIEIAPCPDGDARPSRP
jgi:hypothetical protein